MKIVIAGGQTGGPVVPLLAVAEAIKKIKPRTQVVVMDTASSSAKQLAHSGKFYFYPVVAGKLRRYWSARTILTPFSTGIAFLQALRVLRKFKPDIVLGAGGFVQVPVSLAAWILRIPVLLHQQDVAPSLSNVLSAPFARKITVTFEESLRHFHAGTGLFGRRKKRKDQFVVVTGNPFRESLLTSRTDEAKKYFKLDEKLPVLLVTGGGGGAEPLNRLVAKALPMLTKTVQVIHGTGPGKKQAKSFPNYHPHEFIERMDLAYAASDIVLSRAGISTITELANLGKVSLIIPIPGTHQELNAQLMYERQAAVVLEQEITGPEKIASVVRRLLLDGETQKFMKHNISQIMPKKAADKIAKLVLEITGHGK